MRVAVLTDLLGLIPPTQDFMHEVIVPDSWNPVYGEFLPYRNMFAFEVGN